jgi:hypothetical protein
MRDKDQVILDVLTYNVSSDYTLNRLWMEMMSTYDIIETLDFNEHETGPKKDLTARLAELDSELAVIRPKFLKIQAELKQVLADKIERAHQARQKEWREGLQ